MGATSIVSYYFLRESAVSEHIYLVTFIIVREAFFVPVS